MQKHKVQAGEIVYREGDASDAIYVIESGVIEVLRDKDGQPKRLGVLRKGEIFGETGIILDQPRSTTTRAVTAATLLRVAKERFLETFPPDNPVALPLLRMLCERLADVDRQLVALSRGEFGAARDQIGQMLLLAASPTVEAQIGTQGVEVTSLPFRIGRRHQPGEPPFATANELLLSTPGVNKVSLQHCSIEEMGGTLIVRDLGSAVGTLVNGKRIAEFEGARLAALRFGPNEIIVGGADSPYRFTLLVERL